MLLSEEVFCMYCLVWPQAWFIYNSFSLCYELSLNFFNMLTRFTGSAADWVNLTGLLATLLVAL